MSGYPSPAYPTPVKGGASAKDLKRMRRETKDRRRRMKYELEMNRLHAEEQKEQRLQSKLARLQGGPVGGARGERKMGMGMPLSPTLPTSPYGRYPPASASLNKEAWVHEQEMGGFKGRDTPSESSCCCIVT